MMVSNEAQHSWGNKPLGELVQFLDNIRVPLKKSDRAKRRGQIPYYGANGQVDWIDEYLFDEPLVLLAEDGGFFGSKEHSIAYKIEGKSWVNNHAHVLRPKQEIDIDYLHWILSFYDVKPFLSGSTRFKLTKSDASRMPISYPLDIQEQKRIAETLNKADDLKRKRKEANHMANKLLQAVFLQMFGDPQTNPKKWELKTLPEIVAKDKYSIKRGPFGGSLKKEFFTTTGFLVYEQFHAINNDFSKNRYFIDEAKYKELEMFKVVEGDLIISCSGVTLGRIAEVPKGALSGIINQALLKVSLDKSKMNSKYFMFLFRDKTIQETLFRLSRGSGQPNLPPMPEIKAIKFMTPPIDLQNDFASIVEKIENIMKKQGCSTNEINQLFDSLMSKAFKGELVTEVA
jgi:type I restriction enzyme S subunit